MPLPSVQGYVLGTRQPMNYTSSALDAYLAVSQEMRARHQQMMSDLGQGQDQMLAGQENTRRGEAHQQDMIDAQVNRSMRLEDQAFAREEMGWRREMQPLEMERARMGLEAERYERDTLRPLQLEMDRLNLRKGQFEIKAKAAEAMMMGQKQAALEQDFGTFQKIMTGEVPSPEPSVVQGSFGDMPGGAAGLNGMKINGLKSGQIYWNHDMGQPFAVVDGDDGSGPVAIAPPGNHSFQAGKPQRFTPIRPIAREQLTAAGLPDVFAGVQSPGAPEVLAAKDQARDAHAFLNSLEKGYADIPAAKALIGSGRAQLVRTPGYQLAEADGSLDSPYEKQLRYQKRDSELRWAFGSDDEHREWTTRNPGLLDAFRNLPDDQVKTAVSGIATQWKESAKGAKSQGGNPIAEASQTDTTLLLQRNAAALQGQKTVTVSGSKLPIQAVDQILRGRGFNDSQLEPVRQTDDKGVVVPPVNTGNAGIPRPTAMPGAPESTSPGAPRFRNPFRPSR